MFTSSIFPPPSPLVQRGTVQVQKSPQPAAKPEKQKSRGFRNTLRNLRDRLRTDHKALVRQNHPDDHRYTLFSQFNTAAALLRLLPSFLLNVGSEEHVSV